MPAVGTQVLLPMDKQFPVPLFAYLPDGTSPIGEVPCEIARCLVTDYLQRDKTIVCTVADCAHSSSGRTWVQVEINCMGQMGLEFFCGSKLAHAIEQRPMWERE